MRRIGNWWCTIVFIAVFACSGNGDPAPDPLLLIAANVNGSTLSDGALNIPVEAQVELVFSAALNATQFESALNITGAAGSTTFSISYANASSKALISLSNLAYNTVYTIKVNAGPLGSNGQSLSNAIDLSFTTIEDGTIRQMAPCTSASEDCYRSVTLQDDSQNTGDFSFYSTYPIYLENAEWENLKYAIVVVHGANRDADNYYSWLLNPLNSEGLLENTILIAPEFKDNTAASGNQLYWNNDWREGQKSISTAKISSFEAIDALLERLSNKEVFPVLEKVIITGHSSGGLFTQVYGVTNPTETSTSSSHLTFNYIVANSQYFYYPDNQRYDEQNSQFFTPTGCPTFNHWPLGFISSPSYASVQGENKIDDNLLERKFTYFLGNGTGADPALNMNDCAAVLLGSSRFKRGEHIFSWLGTQYNGQHNSTKVVVNGIGHDGQGMYQSGDFKTLLNDILE